MFCPECGFDNPVGMKFCGECGKSLQPICTNCGTKNPPGFKFCGECGTSLAVEGRRPIAASAPEAERRQLTVLFCDLVGSTPLSGRLDPEEYRGILRDYQSACAEVIGRYEGYIARYFGDGILTYFGYPIAHEDDAQRAVRTGLGILEAIAQLNGRLEEERGLQLQVRLGIHTGIVVAGDVGPDQHLESMAIVGEMPNIAARLEGIAEPDTVVISAATYRLVEGAFDVRDLGAQALKGVAAPVTVYQVLGERVEASAFRESEQAGRRPLVGREQEKALLLERWQQAKGGAGQVVLIGGEAGIGKSRLLHGVKEQLSAEAHTRLEYRCSPYFQNSALYPVIDLLERWLGLEREHASGEKLDRLETALADYKLSLGEAVPLLAGLLSIPLDGRYELPALAPMRQREKTLGILLYLLLETASQQPALVIFEDLHWADPSTLEWLDLIVEQAPTAQILALATFRPDFDPPWSGRAYLSQLTLGNLAGEQTKAIVHNITGGKTLPAEVLAQLVIRTDGVPLFVEELTKMVLESGLLHERQGRYELTGPLPPLAIPATLRDSLTARLDRLASAKEVAQLGATLGREFNYELLQLVSTLDDATLQNELTHLVEAELLYRSGLPPRAKYIFKHALIQEAAYRSQLRSKRQQMHLRVAQVLEEQMPETAETQPELIAHHYRAAGLAEHAVPYWLMAGEQALQRSANVEATNHLNNGLASLESLPDTPERVQQELTLQIALGNALIAIQGYAAPEVRQTYARARELCKQMADTPQLLPVLYGLWANYLVAAEHRTAYKLGQEFLDVARRQDDPSVVVAHRAVGLSSLFLGELTLARTHFESIAALYNPELHQSLAFQYGQDAGASGLSVGSWTAWLLGYPEQSLDWARQAATLARNMSHPLSLAFALTMGAIQFQFRREVVTAREYIDEALTLSDEHGFATWRTWGMLLRGWILAEQGQVEEGVAQMHESLSASRAQGTGTLHPYFLTLLAGMYGTMGRITEGLATLAEALALVEQSGECYWEAEMYRVKGELLRKASDAGMPRGKVGEKKADLDSSPEACFLKAIEISRGQKARSLELRAAVGLCRLWKSQGKSNKGREVLKGIYGWFTEGLDTVDLKEAKALLDSLTGAADT